MIECLKISSTITRLATAQRSNNQHGYREGAGGSMADSRKRIALKPHMDQIREWVETGKTDDWIADALGTSASSVQSFRSRNDIYRRLGRLRACRRGTGHEVRRPAIRQRVRCRRVAARAGTRQVVRRREGLRFPGT